MALLLLLQPQALHRRRMALPLAVVLTTMQEEEEVTAVITTGKSLVTLAQRIKAMIALAPSTASISDSASMGT